MHDIVQALRDALNPNTLLSVKIQAGFSEKSELKGLIEAIAIEGVNEITVHCR